MLIYDIAFPRPQNRADTQLIPRHLEDYIDSEQSIIEHDRSAGIFRGVAGCLGLTGVDDGRHSDNLYRRTALRHKTILNVFGARRIRRLSQANRTPHNLNSCAGFRARKFLLGRHRESNR